MLEVDRLAGPVLYRPCYVHQDGGLAGHGSVVHGLGVQTLDIGAGFGKLFQEELLDICYSVHRVAIPSHVSILVIHLVYGVPILVQLLVVQLGDHMVSAVETTWLIICAISLSVMMIISVLCYEICQ